ncbi:MAG: nicotinate-nucleotide adenylyltransferase [Acidimicrobiia bacterium]
MRRVLLGGTFDPPHVAHLVAGEVAYRQLGADTVTFIPAGAPWQKADQGVTDGVHRLEMTRCATEGVGYFEADDREVLRDGWTYTVDTLESFDPADELIVVMGADAAAGLPGWHRYGDILERATVAVLPRPGTEIRQVEEAIGPVVWLDMPLLDISGTEIRARMAADRPIRFLVADPVWRYIAENGLYRP